MKPSKVILKCLLRKKQSPIYQAFQSLHVGISEPILKNVFDEISNKFGIKAAEEIIGKACSTRKGHSQYAVHSNLAVTLLSPSGAL